MIYIICKSLDRVNLQLKILNNYLELKYFLHSDKDECSTIKNVCYGGRCVNGAGTYRCICDSGFAPSEDGLACHGMSI